MGDERQTDFSTPEVQPDDAVSLTVGGTAVTVPPGNSGLRAAALTRLKRPSLGAAIARKLMVRNGFVWSRATASAACQQVA